MLGLIRDEFCEPLLPRCRWDIPHECQGIQPRNPLRGQRPHTLRGSLCADPQPQCGVLGITERNPTVPVLGLIRDEFCEPLLPRCRVINGVTWLPVLIVVSHHSLSSAPRYARRLAPVLREDARSVLPVPESWQAHGRGHQEACADADAANSLRMQGASQRRWGTVWGVCGVRHSRSGGITYRGGEPRVAFSQRMNGTPESSPKRLRASPAHSDGWC